MNSLQWSWTRSNDREFTLQSQWTRLQHEYPREHNFLSSKIYEIGSPPDTPFLKRRHRPVLPNEKPDKNYRRFIEIKVQISQLQTSASYRELDRIDRNSFIQQWLPLTNASDEPRCSSIDTTEDATRLTDGHFDRIRSSWRKWRNVLIYTRTLSYAIQEQERLRLTDLHQRSLTVRQQLYKDVNSCCSGDSQSCSFMFGRVASCNLVSYGVMAIISECSLMIESILWVSFDRSGAIEFINYRRQLYNILQVFSLQRIVVVSRI